MEQVVREPLGRRAVVTAREDAVQVQTVDRAPPRVGGERRGVGHRDEHDGPLEAVGIARAVEVVECEHPLSLVAVDAGDGH